MIKIILKISITVFFITYLLLYTVDLSKAVNIIAGTNWVFFSIAYFINFTGIILSTIRWRGLLKFRSIKIGYLRLLSYYYIGILYNNFIPGAIGGDTVKMYKMSKEGQHNRTNLMTSIITDRYIGLVVVYFTGIIAFLFSYEKYNNEIRLLFLFVIISYAFFILLLSSKRFFNGFFKLIKRRINLRSNTTQRIYDIYDSLNLVSELSIKKKEAIKIFLPSLGFFFFAYIGEVYLLLYALDSPITYFNLLSFLPILNLIVMLPISLGGLGIREYMFIYFLGGKNISAESALSLCILLLCFRIFNSLIGAIINLKGTRNKK